MKNKVIHDIVLLSGDEALAQGAYEEGLKVACSYPGTPATEILEYLSSFDEVDAQWSVNEKVAYEVALAASIAGLRSLYASKHVGINVAMDPLMTSAYTGVGAGFVFVSCDDPGLHSSQNEQDNRLVAKMAKVPLIEPSSPAEAKEFIKTAFTVSEAYDIPVMMRMTTRVAHTKENVKINVRKEVPQKEFIINIPKYVMVPKNAYFKHIELEKKLIKLKQYSEKTLLNKIEINSKKIGFITSGVSYLYVKEMYPDASFLKLGFSYPFPSDKIKNFAKQVKELFVVEELEPFIEEELKILGVKCKAKKASFRIGELRPELIEDVVNGKEKKEIPQTTRKPVKCPGCSHRVVFSTLKKLKITVTGDIGCYTLGATPPLSSLHTCLCMGSGITFFEGFKKAIKNNVVGVIGDSTFVHSGITGLVNAVYNNAKGLILILDNATTAMTGSQPHPGTGVTIKGAQTKKLCLEDICRVCGVDNVDVVSPFNFKDFEELVKMRVNADALSVIVVRYPCRLIEKNKADHPIYYKDKCKKCGLCLNIDCPAIRKTEDGFVEIVHSVCTGCYLCVEVCKFGALEINEKSEKTGCGCI
jgi:indolepyruvate ferredoxin oxidoreductase alpha subunit